MYCQNCTITGSSKPFCAFHALMAAGDARGPSTMMAGEGKTECSMMKMKIEIPIRITIEVAQRRIR